MLRCAIGHQMEGKCWQQRRFARQRFARGDADGGFRWRSTPIGGAIENCRQRVFRFGQTERAGTCRARSLSGRDVYRRGFGVRDLRSKAPIDAATNFRLASFTKQFTAMASCCWCTMENCATACVDGSFSGFPGVRSSDHHSESAESHRGLPDYEDLMDAVEKRMERSGARSGRFTTMKF